MATRKTRSQTTPIVKKRRVVEEPIPIDEEDDDEQNEEYSDSELDVEGDGDEDEGSGVTTLSVRGRAVGTEQGPTPSTSKKVKINIRSGVTLGLDEMVQNCLYYFLINQHKKIPVKRSDLIRIAMNGQKNNFTEVMAKLEQVLADVFGMKTVGLEKSKAGGWASYIIISVFSSDLAENVTMTTVDSDSRRAVLFILLCVMFMLNRSIDEDMVWKILQEMSLHQLVCKKKEDLRKFLKSEYVSPMYLNFEEIKDTDNVIVRYSWGPRSEKEFSKYSILKFVAKQFPGKRSLDYTVQYNMVMETERALVEADIEEERRNCPEGENGSALVVREGQGYSIDGQGMDVENDDEPEEMDTVEEESESESN